MPFGCKIVAHLFCLGGHIGHFVALGTDGHEWTDPTGSSGKCEARAAVMAVGRMGRLLSQSNGISSSNCNYMGLHCSILPPLLLLLLLQLPLPLLLVIVSPLTYAMMTTTMIINITTTTTMTLVLLLLVPADGALHTDAQ